MAYHSKTIDYGMKMALLMLVPYISNVHTMDKLTDHELNCLIIKEEKPLDNADEPLSFMLAQIFQSFMVTLPDVMELRVEETVGDGSDETENEMSGSGVSDSLPEGPLVEAWKHPFEEIFASFFNIVSGAVAHEQPMVMKVNNAVIHTWSSANATCPVKDKEMQCKPDLALLDNVTVWWDTIKAVCGVVTPGINIVSDPNFCLHILSCLVFSNPECLEYDPLILIFMKTLWPTQLEIPSAFSRPMTNKPPTLDQAYESLVESPMDKVVQGGSTAPSQIRSTIPTMSNAPASASTTKATVTPDPPETEIPTDPLCTHPSQSIRKILVNNHTYDILELIFSSQGLVGHSTVCYLARRGDEEYIIKDHWVLGNKNVALNEVTMLQAMQGVRSVPQLIKHWLVEIGPQEVDEMMSYHGKIWQSIKELISAIRDIVKIQQIAVEEHGILHQDCSLNNSMIEDGDNGSHGTLIDWEFAVHILTGQKYDIVEMGMAPFMSCSLLFQLSEAVGGTAMSQNSWKHASHSHVQAPPLIMHSCQDDLEGPLGMKCVLGPQKPLEGDWLLCLWSTNSFKENKEWYELIRSKGPSHSVTFKEVIDLLTKHLNILPKDEPSPELLFVQKVIDALPGGKRKEGSGSLDDGNLAPAKADENQLAQITSCKILFWQVEIESCLKQLSEFLDYLKLGVSSLQFSAMPGSPSKKKRTKHKALNSISRRSKGKQAQKSDRELMLRHQLMMWSYLTRVMGIKQPPPPYTTSETLD
ncbi:hypothetical protein BDR06DRAFT_966820 [Suillus hirtellus]|nr:hypothetical protein BDR06DRAFT_966820 [Suillus hirtellus]